MVLNAGDSLFRLLLFWGMFLPLHARWSIDANSLPAPARLASPCCTGGTAAFTLQICFLYWFAAFLKSGPRWWDGEAVYYALNLDYFATSFGVWVRQFEWLLPWLTWGTLFWELLGPLLLFMPVWHGGFRTLCVLGFIAMHLGFLACMDIELFPLICITAWIALLPPWFWNHLARGWPRLGEPESRSVCPEPPRRSTALVRDGLAVFFILFTLAWNVRELDHLRWKRLVPGPLDTMGRVMRLDQNWGVFAPSPATDDGWFVFDAELADGRHVDLLTGRSPVSFEKPALVSATLPHRRWGKYLERLKLVRHADQRPLLCRYLTWNWNRTHADDEMLRELNLYFVREDTLATGVSDPRVILMIECP